MTLYIQKALHYIVFFLPYGAVAYPCERNEPVLLRCLNILPLEGWWKEALCMSYFETNIRIPLLQQRQ